MLNATWYALLNMIKLSLQRTCVFLFAVFGFGGALWMFAVNIVRSFMHSKYE